MRKERRVVLYTFIRPCFIVTQLKGAQIWITQFYPQTTPYLPVSRKRSPDGTTTDCIIKYLIAAYYSFVDPERMKCWVSFVGWPIAARFIHISRHPLAVGRAQDRESSPDKNQRSTAVPCSLYQMNFSDQQTLIMMTSTARISHVITTICPSLAVFNSLWNWSGLSGRCRSSAELSAASRDSRHFATSLPVFRTRLFIMYLRKVPSLTILTFRMLITCAVTIAILDAVIVFAARCYT